MAQHPECVTGGAYRDGVLVVYRHALHQDHGQRLGLPPETPMHWGPTSTVEVQELSGLNWPLRYRVSTAEGWYEDRQGQRHYFVPVLKGLCLKRPVSHVARRAGGFLSVIAAIGCRQAAWLLEVLFHVRVGKSSLERWIETGAEDVPSADALVEERNRRQPITAGHFDGYFPRGRKDRCVLVLRDEHGRLVATEEGGAEDEEQVTPRLRRLQRLGVGITTFSIDPSQALRKAIAAVFPAVRRQDAYFHILQNLWKKLWSYAVLHRREVKARRQRVRTAWYQAQLEALAQTLWQQRCLLCKSDERRSPKEQQQLVAIMEADAKVGKLRTFLQGVWQIFRDSRDEREARAALEALKKVKIEPRAHSYTRKVLAFLEAHCEQMLPSLKHDDVQRNSLAASGMRLLRRLEVGHDGFRSPAGRENCRRISQAVKDLGWSVQNPPRLLASGSRQALEAQEPGVTLSPVGKGPPNGPCHPTSTAVG